MEKDNIKAVIAANTRRLLGLGPEDRGATAALIAKGISNGDATRVLHGKTSIGVDKLAELARALRAEPWQLLVPDLDPNRMPTLEPASFRWPFRRIDPDVVLNLVGTPAQQIENGLLASLATIGIEPRKQFGARQA